MLGSSHPTEETCLCPVVSLRNEKVNRSPRATRTPQKIPYAQRAGVRRRSPHSGSAAAGAHIAREAGRCAPTAPRGERQPRYTTCDSVARRHTDKGSTGVVGGVEGHAPLTPCRPPRRRPRPDAGQKPQSSVKKEKRMPQGGDARAPGRSRQPAGKKQKEQATTPPLPCRFAA